MAGEFGPFQPPVAAADLVANPAPFFDRLKTPDPVATPPTGVNRRLQRWPQWTSRAAVQALPSEIFDPRVGGGVQEFATWLPLGGRPALAQQAPAVFAKRPGRANEALNSAAVVTARNAGGPENLDVYSAVRQFYERGVGPNAEVSATWTLVFSPELWQERLASINGPGALADLPDMRSFVEQFDASVTQLLFENLRAAGVGGKYSVSLRSRWRDGRTGETFSNVAIAPPIVLPAPTARAVVAARVAEALLVQGAQLMPSLLDTMLNMGDPQSPTGAAWLYGELATIIKV